MAKPGSLDTDAFLRLVDELRSRGAKRVRMGTLEVEFGLVVPSPAKERPSETPAEKQKREIAEFERLLYFSSPDGAPERES